MMTRNGGEPEPAPNPIASAESTTANTPGDTASGTGTPTDNTRDATVTNRPNSDSGQQQRDTSRDPQRVEPDPEPGNPPELSAAEIAGVAADIDNLQERADGGELLSPILRDLRTIYDMEGVPDSLRARVALVAAVNLEFAGRNEEACNWYQDLINVEPARATGLASAMNNLGCSPD
jgi:hypothetical protein